jgi:transcriptional regulator with XRE-family HTH domain
MHHTQTNPLDRFRDTLDYELANVEMDFTDSLEALMQRRGINKSELARRIETSPAYITKILRGSTNFTLETMVKLVRALEGELHVRACAKEDNAHWFHAIRSDGVKAIQTSLLSKSTRRTQYRLVNSPDSDHELAATA